MKKSATLILLCFCIGVVYSQNNLPVNEWLVSAPFNLNAPAFSNQKNQESTPFKVESFFRNYNPEKELVWPAENDQIRGGGSLVSTWKKQLADSSGIKFGKGDNSNTLYFLAFYVFPDRFVKGSLEVTSGNRLEIYLDGKMVASKYTVEKKNSQPVNANLVLEQKKYFVLIKLLDSSSDSIPASIKACLKVDKNFSKANISINTNPKSEISFEDILERENLGSVSISPDGKLAIIGYGITNKENGTKERYNRVVEVESGKELAVYRGNGVSNLSWTSKGRKITYSTETNDKTSIFTFDFASQQEKLIASEIENLSYSIWSPNDDYLILSIYEEAQKEEGPTRRFLSIEDRWPGWRNRSYLYKLDIKTGIKERLTYGNLSTDIYDISSDGRYILFGTSKPDYKAVPFSLSSEYIMDIQSYKVDTIWKDERNSGSASFSPNGKKLLVLGSPFAFNGIGTNVRKGFVPNAYDIQAYIYDVSTKGVVAISKTFNPNIKSGFWSKSEDAIYFDCEDEDFERLYRYDLNKKEYRNVPINGDILNAISYNYSGDAAVYTSSGVNTPLVAYYLDVKKGTSRVLASPSEKWMNQRETGDLKTYDFKNRLGFTVKGRVYYPPSFDKSKKYPLIVYYYGGTSPVDRTFGGRYPFEVWAAHGYLIYVLQPSGTTGYGQDFSALHVNAWGKYTADDIIEGTKKFLAENAYADSKKVACIGASYGGFMTMYLLTKTDIYTTAISHAGISDITSYWGEGYWGYSYCNVASMNSYPWNNPDLYVKQSPLFSADKIKTPLLLLQGSSDTNVPVGESIQMFNALKILGKPVEMIHIDGEDHHIMDYKKRMIWSKTIIAWFDKYLKDQPLWWGELYPDKNY